MIKLKSTVKHANLVILAAAANAWEMLQLPGDLWVTSGNDSKHMAGSKHFSNEALDFRTKSLSTDQKHNWKEAIQARLGSKYQCILEFENQANEHLHCEYDPL